MRSSHPNLVAEEFMSPSRTFLTKKSRRWALKIPIFHSLFLRKLSLRRKTMLKVLPQR